ncbi:hypothetical protein HDU93_009302, partial [Gonapodya sp. JEL0774]
MNRALSTPELIERIVLYLDTVDRAACVGVWEWKFDDTDKGGQRVATYHSFDKRTKEEIRTRHVTINYGWNVNTWKQNLPCADALQALQQISVHVVSLHCPSLEDEVVTAVSSILLSTAARLRRLDVRGSSDSLIVWLDQLLKQSNALEELTFFTGGASTMTLPVNIAHSLKILHFDWDDVDNWEQIGQYKALQELTIWDTPVDCSDHLKQLSNLSVLTVPYFQDEWDVMATVLSNI